MKTAASITGRSRPSTAAHRAGARIWRGMQGHRSPRLAVALATLTLAGGLTVPAVASAKAKPLTRSQIIALIHKYAPAGRQGPAGATGATGSAGTQGVAGPPGPTTVAPVSGLSVTSGGIALNVGSGLSLNPANALTVAAGPGLADVSGEVQLDPGIVGQSCPNGQFAYGLTSTSYRCDYPLAMSIIDGGYDSATVDAPQGIATTGETKIAQTAPTISTTASYYVNGNVEAKNNLSTTSTVTCELIDTTSSNILRTVGMTVPASAEENLELQVYAGATPASHVYAVECTASSPVAVEGTVVDFPLG
jgi:hypothetical protein